MKVRFTSAEKKTVDISEDISQYLTAIEYTDNMSDKADDLSLTLEDRGSLWLKSWLPEDEGNIVDVEIITIDEEEREYKLGKFEIDEIEVKAEPQIVRLKAVSIVGNSSLRSETKNQTWEKVTIKKIAEDIAVRNKLTLFYDAEDNEEIDHIEQADEADLEFLMRLCKSHGLSMKVTPEQLIIFDEEAYEKEEAKIEVVKPKEKSSGKKLAITQISDWTFRQKTRDTFDSAEVSSAKGKDKTIISSKYKVGEGKKILHISEQVENEREANRLARKKLREKNKDKTKGNFSTTLNLNINAAMTIDAVGFGKFDGKYIIETVRHRIGRENKTSVEMRKCLSEY